MNKEIKTTILFIDDDPIDRLGFKRFALSENFPYDFKISGSIKETLEFIEKEEFDAIISDFNLGDGNALEIIKNINIPVIIITGIGDGETAVKAMKAGAYDFLIKDNSGDYLKTLPIAIENALKHKRAENELIEYREHLEEIVKQRTIELENEIEERKKTEKELLLATRKAKESDRLKSAFLANMSHEIRTPMNAILGFVSLLENDDISVEDRKSYTNIIQKNSIQLLEIISDIIDISKIESQQLKIKYTKCNVNKLLQSLFIQHDTQREQLGKQNISLSYQMNLTDEESTIETDEIRLTQIINNLLSNALKFTESGEVNFGYSFKGHKHLLFHVKDTGIGIKDDKKAIIFERFRQSEESNARDYGGTGLGLSISKGLVELLGGNISLDSQYGEGSTFYFTIPYKKYEEKITFRSQIIEDSQLNLNLEGKTILIVDDRDDVLKYISILLENTNANMLFSSNGLDAVNMFEKNQNKINLVLMDIQLPGIDGYEAISRIKKINSQVPIIVQTAYAFSEDKENSINIGCSDYLTKPISKNELYQKIAKHINS